MKKFVIFLSATILFLIGGLACFMGKDALIMYYGIKFFKRIRLGAFIAAGLSGGLTVYSGVHNAKLKEYELKTLALEERNKEMIIEDQMKKSAVLSVDNKIDPVYIHDSLNEATLGRWYLFKELLESCVAQFEQMDSYQDRFSKLLASNGAKALSDTEDVIDSVEQYMCKNARSVINFMNVADEDAADQVKEKLENCLQENTGLLTKTRDFIYAMTDFLNDQGGKADTRLLESYKDTLIKTMNREKVL